MYEVGTKYAALQVFVQPLEVYDIVVREHLDEVHDVAGYLRIEHRGAYSEASTSESSTAGGTTATITFYLNDQEAQLISLAATERFEINTANLLVTKITLVGPATVAGNSVQRIDVIFAG